MAFRLKPAEGEEADDATSPSLAPPPLPLTPPPPTPPPPTPPLLSKPFMAPLIAVGEAEFCDLYIPEDELLLLLLFLLWMEEEEEGEWFRWLTSVAARVRGER